MVTGEIGTEERLCKLEGGEVEGMGWREEKQRKVGVGVSEVGVRDTRFLDRIFLLRFVFVLSLSRPLTWYASVEHSLHTPPHPEWAPALRLRKV